jgi:hypothetical protein
MASRKGTKGGWRRVLNGELRISHSVRFLSNQEKQDGGNIARTGEVRTAYILKGDSKVMGSFRDLCVDEKIMLNGFRNERD